MLRPLFYLCMINTILIITHEIDAAYWKEWKLFSNLGNWRPFRLLAESSDQTGLTIFLLAHLPLLFVLLYGLILVSNGGGLWYSLFFSSFLVIHFFVHWVTNKKSRAEFTWPVSHVIFWSTLFVSIGQLAITIVIME